jgi:hypothetical protein
MTKCVILGPNEQVRWIVGVSVVGSGVAQQPAGNIVGGSVIVAGYASNRLSERGRFRDDKIRHHINMATLAAAAEASSIPLVAGGENFCDNGRSPPKRSLNVHPEK